MPIFSFVCTSCKKEEDRLVSSSSVNEQKCSCKEDAKMEKVEKIYSSNFALKGNWFKTRGTY